MGSIGKTPYCDEVTCESRSDSVGGDDFHVNKVISYKVISYFTSCIQCKVCCSFYFSFLWLWGRLSDSYLFTRIQMVILAIKRWRVRCLFLSFSNLNLFSFLGLDLVLHANPFSKSQV